MNPYILKRLWRRPWLSLCSLVLTAVLCGLLCYMTGYLQRQEEELIHTKESFQIHCVVTNRRGTEATGLRMAPYLIGAVRDPESELYDHITDLRITKEFLASSALLGLNQETIYGVSGANCRDDLNPAMGGNVVYAGAEFYGREDYVCLVSKECYDFIPIGEDGKRLLNLSLTDPYVNQEYRPGEGMGTATFTVAGYYEGKGKTVYLPFPAALNLASELSGGISCDSISFIAKDNQGLDALGEAASQYFGTVDPSAGENSTPKYALTIHDEQYRATVATLEQNIRRTKILLPLLLAMALGMGFLVSFLGTRGESLAYALMRTVGLTRGRLFLSVLWEQTILPLLAALAVGVYMGQWLPTIIYIACNTVGCCAAVIPAVRVAPTAILREQE